MQKTLADPAAARVLLNTCGIFPAFSFRFMTTHHWYSLESLDDGQLRLLLARITQLSKRTWQSIYAERRKTDGIELIPLHEVAQAIQNQIVLWATETGGAERLQTIKVGVFRFANQKGRLLGIKNHNCSIFDILAVDVHFRAYDHGS